MEPSARIIADSVSTSGHRVTTVEAVLHRFMLAEKNTHRVFSRNSASSRAIPLAKQLARVQADLAYPVKWAAEQKGMQGGDELEPEVVDRLKDLWAQAADAACDFAREAGELGLHKSLCNRLIEPYMWHTAVITSTCWKNFEGLRCSPNAQPEIRATAEAVMAAIEGSTPQVLTSGQWHLPYIQDDEHHEHDVYDLARISAARVARVSYLTQAGIRDPQEDLNLYYRLVNADPMHSSPLEHVCTPDNYNEHTVTVQRRIMLDGVHPGRLELKLPKYGNFIGWHQLRFDVEILKQYQAFA